MYLEAPGVVGGNLLTSFLVRAGMDGDKDATPVEICGGQNHAGVEDPSMLVG